MLKEWKFLIRRGENLIAINKISFAKKYALPSSSFSNFFYKNGSHINLTLILCYHGSMFDCNVKRNTGARTVTHSIQSNVILDELSPTKLCGYLPQLACCPYHTLSCNFFLSDQKYAEIQ